jgi:hypothetical protein
MLTFKKSEPRENDASINHDHLSIDDRGTPPLDKPETGTKRTIRSERQREASRRNGRRGRGPKNTERTRHNAVKHGLRAKGLTELDNIQEYLDDVRELRAHYLPVGPMDTILIEHAALDMVRFRRTARLEAETIAAVSSRPTASNDATPTIDPLVMKEYAGPVLDKIQRFSTATLNRLLRCRRELERKRQNELSEHITFRNIVTDDEVVV